jgi:hypothetical protein
MIFAKEAISLFGDDIQTINDWNPEDGHVIESKYRDGLEHFLGKSGTFWKRCFLFANLGFDS